jgi:electron transport complex protein RnfG
MSKKKTGPVGIVGRLTLILLVTVTFLTAYSNILAKYTDVGGDPAQKTLSNILREAELFWPVMDEEGNIHYYEAYDSEGALIGFGFIQSGRGMWGGITVAGVIDLDYRIMGIVVLEQGETPGLGARIVENKFLNQFIGLETNSIKLKKYNGAVDAISGATVSSKSVTDIIRKEVERVLEQRSGIE